MTYPTTASSRLARCFEIARECLAGDPLREVPALETEIDQLAGEHAQAEPGPAVSDEFGHLPAYQVADNALGLAGELAEAAI
jgi:hypothetical protein